MGDELWLVARFWMENRRGYGQTTHLAPLQAEAVVMLNAASGQDIETLTDDEITALFKPGATPEPTPTKSSRKGKGE